MNKGKTELGIGLSIVLLVRNIMEKYNVSPAEAFRLLAGTRLFELIWDAETGLFLESDKFLLEAFCLEKNLSESEMLRYIQRE